MMKPFDWLLLIVGVIVVVMIGTALAYADDAHMRDMHGTPERDAFFRGLMQPDNGISCCSLNDCFPTEAEQLGDGNWRAKVKGIWRDMPANKIVKKPSIDGEAYVCHSLAGKPENATIYCFLPPIPGS